MASDQIAEGGCEQSEWTADEDFKGSAPSSRVRVQQVERSRAMDGDGMGERGACPPSLKQPGEGTTKTGRTESATNTSN